MSGNKISIRFFDDKEHNQLGSLTTQFNLTAPDGKKHLSNVMDYNQVIELAKNFPNNKSTQFIQCLPICLGAL
ncbi:hypothetical protein [Treponema socranskii]|uniref:hypothetical protein n=1 Tax=Treponema socranskii TaxID=53419 RepID=UPI003D922143